MTTALYRAGYGSSSRFYERARDQLGMSPARYRRGAGMRIVYAIAACPLGRLLVGATEHGICAISLGSDDAALAASLKAEYPAAEIRRGDATARPAIAALLAHLAGHQAPPDFPLDIAGTAFQRRVWDVLRTIPYGATRTYAELARGLGAPTASRAVAQACAKNPVAVVVPCHRVVRADGGLGGYRWGTARKRALLTAEAQVDASDAAGDGITEASRQDTALLARRGA